MTETGRKRVYFSLWPGERPPHQLLLTLGSNDCPIARSCYLHDDTTGQLDTCPRLLQANEQRVRCADEHPGYEAALELIADNAHHPEGPGFPFS